MSAKSSSRTLYAGFFTFFNIVYVFMSIVGTVTVRSSWNNMNMLIPICLSPIVLINSIIIANIIPKAFVDTDSAVRMRKMALHAPIIVAVCIAICAILINI